MPIVPVVAAIEEEELVASNEIADVLGAEDDFEAEGAENYMNVSIGHKTY